MDMGLQGVAVEGANIANTSGKLQFYNDTVAVLVANPALETITGLVFIDSSVPLRRLLERAAPR